MKILEELQTQDHYNNEYTHTLLKYQNVFWELFEICCSNKWVPGSGSYLISGKTYEYYIGMYNKQKFLFDTCKSINSVLEIGTYMGHSLFIMLLANPKLRATCVDIDLKFSLPAITHLQKTFPEAQITLLEGNSHDIIPSLSEKYELFHIDGNHNEKAVRTDFENVLPLTQKQKVKVIFDDVDECMGFFNSISQKYKTENIFITESEWRNAYIEIIT